MGRKVSLASVAKRVLKIKSAQTETLPAKPLVADKRHFNHESVEGVDFVGQRILDAFHVWLLGNPTKGHSKRSLRSLAESCGQQIERLVRDENNRVVAVFKAEAERFLIPSKS